MAGRSPARFLAPLALVGFAIALIVVIGASSSSDGEREAPVVPAETRTTTGESQTRKPARRRERASKTYTVQRGDTPSGIAAANGITTERLLELNPDLDPSALTVGEKVRIE